MIQAALDYYFDVEFHEYDITTPNGQNSKIVDFISIGIVCEDGRTFYAVHNGFNLERAEENKWISDNVLSRLPPQDQWLSMNEIRTNLKTFLSDNPAQFYYYFAPHDALILLDLVKTSDHNIGIMSKPSHIRAPIDVAQDYIALGCPQYIYPDHENPHLKDMHNALSDAYWVKELKARIDDVKMATNEDTTKPKPPQPPSPS